MPAQVPFTSSSYEGMSFFFLLLMMASPLTLTALPVLRPIPPLSLPMLKFPAAGHRKQLSLQATHCHTLNANVIAFLLRDSGVYGIPRSSCSLCLAHGSMSFSCQCQLLTCREFVLMLSIEYFRT